MYVWSLRTTWTMKLFLFMFYFESKIYILCLFFLSLLVGMAVVAVGIASVSLVWILVSPLGRVEFHREVEVIGVVLIIKSQLVGIRNSSFIIHILHNNWPYIWGIIADNRPNLEGEYLAIFPRVATVIHGCYRNNLSILSFFNFPPLPHPLTSIIFFFFCFPSYP